MADVLQQVRTVVESWRDTEPEKLKGCGALLEKTEQNMATAVSIWREIAAQEPGQNDPFTVVLWFGAERAKALHGLYLEQLTIGAQLTELTGIAFKDSLGIVAEIDIVQAYGQLRRDESPTEHAEEAIEVLCGRQQQMRDIRANC